MLDARLRFFSFRQINQRKKKYVLCFYVLRQAYNSRIVSQTMVVARGAENILPTAWRRRRGGHSGGLNAMIDGLHHKLATIGAPSRLLQQPSFPEKKPEHPSIFLACLQIRQPNLLLHTTIVPPVIQQSNLLFFLTQQGYVLCSIA